MRASAFETHRQFARLHKPVDRSEWDMTPPTVNAYYNPVNNEIVFPAGILQPPFFNPAADDAVNYGSIGAVIGHEITHGFDDQGSRSDADGNLRNWWTPEDRSRFTAKAEKLVKQYGECVAVDDVRVNGKLTLGENLADLGGVNIAYAAYLKSLGGKEPHRHRRLHRPAAVLHRLCPIVVRFDPRRRAPRPNPHQPPLARALPHARAALERRGVLQSLRRQADRQDVPRPGGARGSLVINRSTEFISLS